MHPSIHSNAVEFKSFREKALVLWRAAENLQHIMHAKKVLGKSITDSKPL